MQFAKLFFVYIIESNRPAEVQLNLNEGAALAQALSFAGLACRPMTVKSKQELAFFLSFGGPFQVHFSPGVPIVHFSGHGSDVGVQVTSGEFISWRELALALGPLRDCTNGRFLIAMSCCKGAFAAKGLMAAGLNAIGVVGPSMDAYWSDNVVAYITFYHHLSKGTPIEEAVEAMRVAAGSSDYHFIPMSHV